MRRIYVISLLMLAVSCGQKSEEVVRPRVDFLASAERTLSLESVSEVSAMSRDSIINPHAILSLDDYIVLVDSRTWKALTIYNEVSGEYDRVLSRGNANNEIKLASELGLVSAEEGSFFLRDLSQSRIFKMGINRTSGRVELLATSNISRLGSFSDFGYDGDFVVGGVSSATRRYLVGYAPRSRVVARFGDFSAFEFDRDSSLLGTIGYPGRMALDRSNKRFAYLSQRGETIEIGSYNDSYLHGKERSKQGDLSDEQRAEMSDSLIEAYALRHYLTADSVVVSNVYNMPRFSTSERGDSFNTTVVNSGMRYGFASSTASAGYIYSLYDGRTVRQQRKDNDEDGLIGNLCVMDWQGRLLLRITSELGFKAISYNDSNGRLYCLCMTDSGEYEVRIISERELFE